MRNVLLATIVCMAYSGIADASQITATLNQPFNFGGVYVAINNGVGGPVYENYGYAGFLPWTVTSSQPSTHTVTFCVEINQFVYIGSQGNQFTTSSASDFYGQDKANALMRLYDYKYSTLVQDSSSTSLKSAAAFQMAVWKIVDDFNTNPSNNHNLVISSGSGNFRASDSNNPSLVAMANTWLQKISDDISNGTPFSQGYTLTVWQSGNLQDQLEAEQNSSPNVITPEPASVVMFSLGAIGLAYRFRRRMNAFRVAA